MSGGGAGKIFTEEDFKRRFSTAAAAKKENHAHFGRRYEGGSSRNFFFSTFFLRALPVEACFCNDRKQRQKAWFCLQPEAAPKTRQRPKKTIGKTRFLENKRFECATRTGKKRYILIIN